MMIHDGYHDFYNDKSKAFKKLFLKHGKILREYADFLKGPPPPATGSQQQQQQ